ncbi:MAG: insulinase family protein [Thermoanaerobaculia bacterium]|nr:insulinase family protein [Thermoanaerobaculia bacterium]
MTIRKRTLVAAAAAALLLGGPAAAQEVKGEEHVLPNGMKLLLVHRPDEPSVAAGWVAKVGSANERVGITGISHLFEHMMFKGTTTLGSKDPKRDLEIIAEQEKLRDEMRAEESKMRVAWRRGEIDDISKPENRTPRYKELEAKFDALVKEQRDLLVKNEFDRIYTKNGASGMNAFTSYDMTAYFITVPKNKLELWFWMESDRLRDPVFREFYAERDVVYEERRLRVESTPTGKLDEAFESIFWHSTPYTWPVIGYPSDVANITKAQADEYFATFYAPNNLTAVLVGDFDKAEALRMASDYFGRIPRGKTAPPEVITLPAKWQYDLRFEGEADTNPTAEIRWHTVPFQHKDSYALSILAELLNGRTGRLYKSMVLPADAVATQASAAHNSFVGPAKYAGSFTIGAEAKEGKTPAEVAAAALAEIERLKKEPVPADELQKVKNNVAANSFRRLSSNFFILLQLMVSEAYGDWTELNSGPKKLDAVTAADVQRVAQTYLVKENQATALVSRKAGSAPSADDSALADVPEQMRPMIKQSLQRLAAETDAEKLKQAVAQMEGQASQVPPQMKKGLDLLVTKAKERLAELETAGKK